MGFRKWRERAYNDMRPAKVKNTGHESGEKALEKDLADPAAAQSVAELCDNNLGGECDMAL